MRNVAPFGVQRFAMNQVAGRLAGEDGPAIRLRQQVAAVNEDAASRGESAGVQVRRRPVLADRIDLRPGPGHRRFQFGRVFENRRHGEIRIALQIAIRQHDVPEVVVVIANEPLAPVVERQPVLAHAGDRLLPAVDRVEAKIHAAEVDRPRVAVSPPLADLARRGGRWRRRSSRRGRASGS